MARPISITVKIGILVIFALVFGATMIALSVRESSYERHGYIEEAGYWGEGKKVEQAFAVGPGGKLIVDADIGDVIITGTSGDSVSIVMTARGSERSLERYDVNFSQEGNTIRVKGDFDHDFGNFFHNNNLDVRFEIQVPVSCELDLETSGGDIDIQEVKGPITGHTSGGDVLLSELEGTVFITTSGGDIKGHTLTGPIEVETSGGDIIFTDVDGSFSGSTSGGDIRVSLADNKGIDVSTSGGDVTITIPSTASATVDASTSGGDVSCELDFSGKIKDGDMVGKINGGGSEIRARSTGGDISINSRL